MKTYLLDSNIIIYLFRDNLEFILKCIDESKGLEYKIDNNVALELLNSRPEKKIHSIDRILRKHIINNDFYVSSSGEKENRLLTSLSGNTFFIKGNKVSQADYGLLMICLNTDFILVTDDKKLLKNARRILDSEKIVLYEEFVKKFEALK